MRPTMKRKTVLSQSKLSGFRTSRPTSAGIRSVDNNHYLAVPSLGKESKILQNVPEHQEMDLEAPSVSKPKKIFQTEDWNSLQEVIKELFEEKDPFTEPGRLYKLHGNVRNILKSKTGTFLTDYYKQELLAKGMHILAERLKNVKGVRFLQRTEEIWISFYKKILPALESILYLVKPKGRLTIRITTLAAFRDFVVFKFDFKGIVSEAISLNKPISEGIKHMLLILQSVKDCYPPNKTQLLVEATTALVVSPYLGFLGLYEGKSTPSVDSNEPSLASRRRSSADVTGSRRISRPFSLQPVQLDTLNQMFINAIRNKQESY